MANLPFCSVIVPTYQREQVLCDTIAYLLDLSYPNYELIVVDQTPLHEPQTEQFLLQVAPRIRYIQIDQVGMCHARNVGIKAAKGDILLFCDDDIIPTPDLLTNHVRHYRDPAVGGVAGPCGFQPDGPFYLVRDFYLIRGQGGEIPRHPLPTTVVETEGAPGGNMSFRKQILVCIGGSDEGFIIRAHKEDIDLSIRVRALGYRILFDPQAKIEHLDFPSGGSRAFIKQEKRFLFGVLHNQAYFFAKHIPLWQLPYFLYSQLGGRLLYSQIWQRRRVDFLRPGLTGLADGLWRGWKARRQMRDQLEQAKRQKHTPQ